MRNIFHILLSMHLKWNSSLKTNNNGAAALIWCCPNILKYIYSMRGCLHISDYTLNIILEILTTPIEPVFVVIKIFVPPLVIPIYFIWFHLIYSTWHMRQPKTIFLCPKLDKSQFRDIYNIFLLNLVFAQWIVQKCVSRVRVQGE